MKKILMLLNAKSLALLTLLLFSSNIFATPITGCGIKRQNGTSICYTTTLSSVTQNINGSFTIVVLVEVDGSSGGAQGTGCQALSHYSIQTDADNFSVSNVFVHVVTGSMTYTEIVGPDIGKSQSFYTGIKVDGTNNFGDNHQGSFTVTYTVNHLQDQQFAAKAGNYDNIVLFTVADFQTVLACSHQTGPTANNDETTTFINTPVDIDVLHNDVEGSSAIDPTSVTFIGTAPPASTGTFTVNHTTGLVTFTPAEGYTGIATIGYRITDANGLSSTATIKVTISPALINYFPFTGYGTLAFEDLWPSKGDYDFNDLILDYQFQITSNSSNFVDKVVGTFVIKAFGASFENGFGFQLPAAINANDLNVTGYSLKESFINLNDNGTEMGQAKPTIIVYDNAFKQMTHPGVGIGVNTDPSAPYVTPKTLTITINFKPNTYTLSNLDISNFNPFLIVNKVRGVEVHLPNYLPTSLANTGLLGTDNDNSNPSQNRYYKTANNLPWAINFLEHFDYPKEKIDIIQTYLHFADWVSSGGTSYQDWYNNLSSGYRNTSLIYTKP